MVGQTKGLIGVHKGSERDEKVGVKIGLKDLEVKGKQRTAKGQLQYTLAGPSPFADKIKGLMG